MPFPNPPSPKKDPTQDRARQAAGLKVVIVFLLFTAVVFGVFVTAIPLPIRLFVAATDVAVAAVLWLVLRQKFSKK